MHYLAATLHTAGFRVGEAARTKFRADRELGSVTIENVLWAVASIVFAGIVVAAIKSYVTSKAGEIK